MLRLGIIRFSIWSKSPGQYSDRFKLLVYLGLSKSQSIRIQADSLAKEFNELLNSKGPNRPQVQQIYQNATGKSLFRSSHPIPVPTPRDGGTGGMTTAQATRSNKLLVNPSLILGMASTAYVTDPKFNQHYSQVLVLIRADPQTLDIPKMLLIC